GLQVEGSTIYWWLQQSKEAQEKLLIDPCPLKTALKELYAFIALNTASADVKVWAKGPSFDLSKLADAYRACKINIPWHHSNERCVRTEIDGYEALIKK